MSEAEAAHLTTAPVRLAVRTVRAAGTSIVGGVRSATVIEKEACVDRPSDVALHETVVLANGNVAPDGGLQLEEMGRPAPSTAVTAYATRVPAELCASTVKSAGTKIRGG